MPNPEMSNSRNQIVKPRVHFITLKGVVGVVRDISDLPSSKDDYRKPKDRYKRNSMRKEWELDMAQYLGSRSRALLDRQWRRELRRSFRRERSNKNPIRRRSPVSLQATIPGFVLPPLEDVMNEDYEEQLRLGYLPPLMPGPIWTANRGWSPAIDWHEYDHFDFEIASESDATIEHESESDEMTQDEIDEFLEANRDNVIDYDEYLRASIQQLQDEEEDRLYKYDRFEQEYFYWQSKLLKYEHGNKFWDSWTESMFSDTSNFVFYGFNPCLKELFDDVQSVDEYFEPTLFDEVSRIDFAWLATLIKTMTQSVSLEAFPSLNDLGGTMTSIMEFVLRNSAQWAKNPLTAISSVVEAFIGKISAMSVQACWNAFFKEIVLVMSSVIVILVGKFLGVPKLFISIAYMVLTVAFGLGANGVNKKTIITLTLINVVFALGTDNIDDYMAKKVSLQGPFDILPRVVFLLAAVCFGHMLPASTDFLTMLRKFDAIPKAITGIEKLADMLTGSFDTAADAFYKCAYGSERPKVTAIPEEVEQHYAAVVAFDYDKMSQVPSNPILCQQLGDLWHQYMTFRSKYSGNSIVKNFLNAYQGNMQKFYDKASSTNPKPMEQRVKPVGVFFYGGSGVGKSCLINFINVNILRRKGLITPETTKQEVERLMNACVYARAKEQEFWDRYQNQLICVYDDIFQLKDHDQVPNEEYFEMIRAINTFAYPLHKAEISEKANSYFMSDFFIGSTNLRVIKPKSTVEVSATISRMHLNYAVRVKQEYRKDPIAEFQWAEGNNTKFGINPSAVLEKTGKSMSLDVYEILRWNPETGVIDETEILSLEMLEKEIWEQHLSHKRTKEASTEMLIEYARTMKLDEPVARDPVSQEALNFETHAENWLELDSGCHGSDFFIGDLRRSFLAWAFWLADRGFPEEFVNYVSAFHTGNEAYDFNATEAVNTCRPGFFRNWVMGFHSWRERQEMSRFDELRSRTHLAVERARAKAAGVYEKTKEFVANHAAILTGITAIVGILGAAYAWYRKDEKPKKIDIVKSAPIMLECLHDSDTHSDFYQTVDGGIKIVTIDDGLLINGKQFEWTAFEDCDVMICTKSMLVQIFNDIGAHFDKKAITITKCGECRDVKTEPSGMSVHEVMLESGVSKDMSKKASIESGKDKNAVLKAMIESGADKHLNRKVVVESGLQKEVSKKVNLESESAVALESFHSHQSMEVTRVVRQAYGFVLTMEGRYVAPVLNVGGRMALMNLHYWKRIPDLFKYKLPYGKNAYFNLKKSDVVMRPFERKPGQETDLVLVTWPRVVPVTRNLMKSFVDQDQLRDLEGSQFVLLSPGLYDNHGAEQTFMHKNGTIERVEVAERDVIELGRKLTGLEVYSRDCRTEPGDCGGVYVLDENKFRGKICAVHFAGALSGGAVGVLITRQDLEKIPDIEFESTPYDPSCEDLPVEGVIFHSRTAPAPLPIISGFEPTKVKGLIDDCGTEPVKLSKFLEPEGPGVLGLRKVGGCVYRPEDRPLKLAIDSYAEKVFSGAPHEEYEKRVLSFEEAAGGIEGTPFVRGVNRSRSPGYPWVLSKGGNKGKRQWLGNDEWTFGEQCQPLREAVESKVAAAAAGVWIPSPFIDAQKDETRPRGKKTRVFSMAAQEMVIALRMYFLGFFSYLMRNRIDNELAVGIRSQSMDWHKLARKLTSKGDKVIAGDFTDYDGNLNPSFLWVVCDMANRWYNDGNDKLREILWLDVVNSMHVAGDFLYQWSHSQPSGNPGTAIINSIANSLMCRYVYYSMAVHADEIIPFNDVVEMVSYGDDNVLNVSSRVSDWFNQLTMSEIFPTIGMVYTDADKSVVQRPYVSIREASFLKRGFRMEGGVWYGPLERRSINNRMEWQKKGSNMETLVENAKAAVAEWALHGDEEFEYWSKRIQTVFMDELNIAISINQKQDYLDLVRSGKMETEFPFLCFA